MSVVPSNVIFIWSGTNASIPSGWSRETGLDSKFPKGTASATDPNDTGGSTAHSHTSPNHSHTITAHTHSVSLNAAAAGKRDCGHTEGGGPRDIHGHVAATSGAASGSTSSVGATYSSINSEPLHKTVIFIKSNGTGVLSNNVIAFIDETVPSGWQVCNGTSGSPNYNGYYLKGAGTGGNASDIPQKANTHIHTITHTHSDSGHTHAQFESGTYTETVDHETQSGDADCVLSHSHHIDLLAHTISIGGTPSSSAVSNEPSYKKLVLAQNQTGSAQLPIGTIGLWLSSLASIPSGWAQVSAMNSFHLKGSSSTGDIGNTGGSNTHVHSDSHTHTGASHNHSASVETQAVTNNTINNGSHLPPAHAHTANVSSTSASWQSTNTSANSSNHEPSYRTVAFIKSEGNTDISDSISVTENTKVVIESHININDNISIAENYDQTVREGLSISIWQERIKVSEYIDWPGERDIMVFYESISISEHVNIKIQNDINEGYKPMFKVEY